MTRSRAGGRLLLFALVMALVGVGQPLVTAGPAAASACSSSAGVTVVVDYQGSISVGCAASPGDGLQALSQAGHGYTFVVRQPGLVCQIDSEPSPCNGAKATAYWSYWHASRGGGWSYSNSGAGSYSPSPGSVEGWSFGAGNPPGIDPPDAVVVLTTSSSRTTTSGPTSTPLATSSTSQPTHTPSPAKAPPTSTHSTSIPAPEPASTSVSSASQSSSSQSSSLGSSSTSSESSVRSSTTHPPAKSPPAATHHPTSTSVRSSAPAAVSRASTQAASAPTLSSTSASLAPSSPDPSVSRTAEATADTKGSAGGWWGVGIGIVALLGLGGAALATRSRRSGP